MPELQKWVARNPWFSDPRFAEQQRAAITINSEMIAQGMDPHSASFYDELDRRIHQAGIRIPEGPASNQLFGTAAAPAVTAPPVAQPTPKKEPKLVRFTGVASSLQKTAM
jgi:hypothetical protein